MEKKAGIYIHIPFCESRCIYCGFYSTTHNTLQHRYTDALLKEMELRRNELGNNYSIDTIYIGGGTPSVLQANELQRILATVNVSFTVKAREITIEMNPDDITPELVAKVKAMGINRISMGVQTFSDQRLRFIRRRHTSLQAMKAVEIVRNAGIINVSIDLMFGFPGETVEDWQQDVEQALALAPSHISAYSLMFEEETPLYHMLKLGKVKQIDEETSLAMYTLLTNRLKANGYEHYEISNYALPGCRSIHNSSYWHDTPYLGFGASAHSYTGNKRSWNVDNIKEYIEAIEQCTLPSTAEEIDADTHYNDLITTALRTCEGLDLSMISDSYKAYAIKNAEENIRNGLLELTDGHLRLTAKGVFVSDGVMSDLIKI